MQSSMRPILFAAFIGGLVVFFAGAASASVASFFDVFTDISLESPPATPPVTYPGTPYGPGSTDTIVQRLGYADTIVQRLTDGSYQFSSFFDVFTELSVQGASSPVSMQGTAELQFTGSSDPAHLFPSGSTSYNVEMLSMDLAGGTGGMVREDLADQSSGQVTVTDIGGGSYRIDSFFDVFTDLSIDGGSLDPRLRPPRCQWKQYPYPRTLRRHHLVAARRPLPRPRLAATTEGRLARFQIVKARGPRRIRRGFFLHRRRHCPAVFAPRNGRAKMSYTVRSVGG